MKLFPCKSNPCYHRCIIIHSIHIHYVGHLNNKLIYKLLIVIIIQST